MESINIVSLVISTLIPMVVGFVYYSKPVFGPAWMDSLKLTDEKLERRKMSLVIIFLILMSLALSFFLFGNVNGLGQDTEAFDTFKHGALHGSLVAIMLVMPIIVINGLFEMKRWKNMLINCLYWFISLALMGGILDVMNTVPESFFSH